MFGLYSCVRIISYIQSVCIPIVLDLVIELCLDDEEVECPLTPLLSILYIEG